MQRLGIHLDNNLRWCKLFDGYQDERLVAIATYKLLMTKL